MKQVSVFQPDWIKTADDQRPPLNKERLSEDEAARVGDYLEAGATVMHTTARGVDILNNDEKVVPLTIRTDGEYVWTGPVTYYVQTYAVAPDADFLAHVRARDYQMGEVSAAEVEAAAALGLAVAFKAVGLQDRPDALEEPRRRAVLNLVERLFFLGGAPQGRSTTKREKNQAQPTHTGNSSRSIRIRRDEC